MIKIISWGTKLGNKKIQVLKSLTKFTLDIFIKIFLRLNIRVHIFVLINVASIMVIAD